MPPITIIEPVPVEGAPTSIGGFMGLLVTILGWIQVLFWILAIAFGLYAAFMYLTARGDPEKIKQANHMLIYVVVAVVVAIIAFAIPSVVSTLVIT